MGRRPARAMPTAAPVMASSDSGVPKARCGPYFSARPRVVPWMAFGSSTSRPNRTTDGSRAISWSVASRTASTKESVRGETACRGPAVRPCWRGRSVEAGDGMGFLLEDVAGQLLGAGERAVLGEGEGRGHLAADLLLDRGPRLGAQRLGQAAQRVGGEPRPGLLLGAVAEAEVVAGADVLAPAVGRHLEEPRALAGPDAGPPPP